MRIAILTFHRAANCGAVLQAWALKTVLTKMGHAVEFPKVNNVGNEEGVLYHLRNVPYWRKGLSRFAVIAKRAWLDLRRFGREPAAAKLFREFRGRFFSERDCTIAELPRHYDLAIIGSDQVWNPILLDNNIRLFFAELIPPGLPLVAYAASCGDHPLKEADIERLARQLPRFKAISVREEFAREQVGRKWKGHMEVVADPTLLLAAKDYQPLIAEVSRRKRPYLYMYTLYESEALLKTAREVANRMELELVVTLAYPENSLALDPVYETNVTPDRMAAYIAHAACVIAASFHGTVMSVIFERPFVSICDFTWRKLGRRQRTLLTSLGLESRSVKEDVSADALQACLTQPLPVDVPSRLAGLRENSFKWLKNAVSGGREQ